jgi:hypothetical protein
MSFSIGARPGFWGETVGQLIFEKKEGSSLLSVFLYSG